MGDQVAEAAGNPPKEQGERGLGPGGAEQHGGDRGVNLNHVGVGYNILPGVHVGLGGGGAHVRLHKYGGDMNFGFGGSSIPDPLMVLEKVTGCDLNGDGRIGAGPKPQKPNQGNNNHNPPPHNNSPAAHNAPPPVAHHEPPAAHHPPPAEVMMAKFCGACGGEFPGPGVKFCPSCGAKR